MVGAEKRTEREFALPDVAMELPSHFPSDYWDRGPGPSRAHAFGGEEVSNKEKSAGEPSGPSAQCSSGFSDMKRRNCFLLSPCSASPSQGYPQ